MPRTLPQPVRALIERHQAGGAAAAECRGCASSCCTRSGFAILENIVQIYEKYRRGKLTRKDYRFIRGLSLDDFCHLYFDVWICRTGTRSRPQNLACFHPRSLTGDGRVIAVPGQGDYYEARARLLDGNPKLSAGCVFLSEKTPPWPRNDGTKRHCILHEPRSSTHVTAKPIDCVFHTCEKPFTARDPSRREAREWFRALARSFPGSVRRFAIRSRS